MQRRFQGSDAETLSGGEDGQMQVRVDQFGVTSYDFDGGRVFSLRGELDASTCGTLTQRLIGAPGSLIVVDLRDLSFMDSSGLGAIHRARRKALKEGGTLVVCRPSPMVTRVLEITGLDIWITDWDAKWADRSAEAFSPKGVQAQLAE
jgi:anti-anti-sigma factor